MFSSLRPARRFHTAKTLSGHSARRNVRLLFAHRLLDSALFYGLGLCRLACAPLPHVGRLVTLQPGDEVRIVGRESDDEHRLLDRLKSRFPVPVGDERVEARSEATAAFVHRLAHRAVGAPTLESRDP